MPKKPKYPHEDALDQRFAILDAVHPGFASLADIDADDVCEMSHEAFAAWAVELARRVDRAVEGCLRGVRVPGSRSDLEQRAKVAKLLAQIEATPRMADHA